MLPGGISYTRYAFSMMREIFPDFHDTSQYLISPDKGQERKLGKRGKGQITVSCEIKLVLSLIYQLSLAV